jgi:tetratricopeptide (TPR) repeat protein
MPENRPASRREIVLITRSEPKTPDPWARLEALAKITSAVAVPLLLAFVGWIVQGSLATKTASKDYVQLAISILNQPQHADVDPALRTWAVQLLNANSPTEFSETVITKLKSGAVTLPVVEQSENMRDLAKTYVSSGDLAKAEETFTKALALVDQATGRSSATVAAMANLAAFYAATGKYAKAEALYNQALEINQNITGPDDVGTARLLTEMAALAEKSGDLKRATEFRQRADAIFKKETSP